MTALAPTLQAFFTDRLIRQRHASPQTVAAYRDAIKLLLAFAQQQTGKQPSELDLADIDVELVGAFLDHLEHERRNTPRTRNARLAAIRSLFRFAALRHPEHAASIARVLAIPPKRFERGVMTYLTEPEVNALLAAPDRSAWTGRRDHTLLLVAVHARGERPDRARACRAQAASASSSSCWPRVQRTTDSRWPRCTPVRGSSRKRPKKVEVPSSRAASRGSSGASALQRSATSAAA
jgi:integrase